MSEPEIRGWCPGALRPMLAGDGLLVRLRPRAGRLSQAQALGVARLSRLHGNGLVDLTLRANLQLRGVSEATLPAVTEGLRELDLFDADAEAEARRNVVVTPFWQRGDGVFELAVELSRALACAEALALPGKFGFAVDCGDSAVLRSTAADVRIERGASGRLRVRAEGFGTGAVVAPGEAVEVAMALARRLVERPGEALPGRFHEGDALPDAAPGARVGPMPQGWLAGVAFGQLQAETLSLLATLGALRLTPWRMLLVEGLEGPTGLPGLVDRADDPRLRVVACVGAPSCLQALAPTRALAGELAAHLLPGETLHVAGCTKGCAHPSAAPTVVATRRGFDFIRHGKAGTPADVRDVPAEDLPSLLRRTLDAASL